MWTWRCAASQVFVVSGNLLPAPAPQRLSSCLAAAGNDRADDTQAARILSWRQGGRPQGLYTQPGALTWPACFQVMPGQWSALTVLCQQHSRTETWESLCPPQVLAFIQGKAPSPAEPAPKEKPAKVKGRVIIVGAGPAGLAAAMHLKVRMFRRSPCRVRNRVCNTDAERNAHAPAGKYCSPGHRYYRHGCDVQLPI